MENNIRSKSKVKLFQKSAIAIAAVVAASKIN